MNLVVDASVVLKWFVEEDGSAAAETVAAENDLIAPDLVIAEVCNGLWTIARLGRLSLADATEAAHVFEGWFEALVPIRELARRAFELGGMLDHPVYDCFYLALAEARDTVLVTADRRFAARVAASPLAPRLRLLHDAAGMANQT
jgi:predicted nucleic acid-binding protein